MHFSNSIRTGLQILSCCLSLGVAHAQTTVPGKIPGEFSVSPSGAATYRIPIQVPPGIAGMEPKLALVYNSQAGNGIMGMGWSLEGLSAITRCPKTMATDGVRGAITHTPEDRFCMDGQRLINVAGAYGAAGSEYRTEIDSFSKVIANGAAAGNATNGPESFTVKTKAGLTLEYGSTADSRIEAQGKAVVRVWTLSKMRDAKGNEITYAYTEDNANGEYNIASVSYADSRIVIFEHDNRPDTFRGFAAGSRISQSKRLKALMAMNGVALFNNVIIEYSESPTSGRSLAQSLKECRKGFCFSSKSFNWLSGQVGFDAYRSSLINTHEDWWNDQNRIRSADVNGDGLSDIVLGPSSLGNWHVVTSVDGVLKSEPFWLRESYSNWSENTAQSNRIHSLDLNGDGKSDFAIGPSGVTGDVYVLESDGAKFINHGTWLTSPFDNWSGEQPSQRIRPMDVDGDGLQDLVLGPGSSGAWYVLRSTGKSLAYSGAPWALGMHKTWSDTSSQAVRTRVMDIDGDGREDILIGPSGTNGNWYCVYSTDGSFRSETCLENQFANWSDGGQRIRPMDVNGDGLLDIVLGPGSTGNWYVAYNTGTGFVRGADLLAGKYAAFGNNDSANRIRVVDLNKDGLQDILIGPSSSGKWYYLQSNGSAFIDKGEILVAFSDWWNLANRIRTMNINGDSMPDLILGPTSSGTWHSMIGKDVNEELRSITSSGVALFSFEYGYLTDSAIYSADAGDSYPKKDVRGPIRVLQSSAQSDGRGGFNTIRYSYGGLKAEHASVKPEHAGSGRGMLGFRWMKSREESTGIETYTEFSQQWPHTGQVLKSETRLIKDGVNQLLKRSVNTPACYQSEAPAGAAKPAATALCTPWSKERVYFPFVASSTEESWDLNGAQMPTLFSQSLYGGYADQSGTARQFGDPTQITVDISEGGVLKHRKVTTNQYRPAKTDGANWESGRLNRASVTSSQY